jgi:nicotinate phosphoribosyltransferase
VDVAGPAELGALRIDSGDLVDLARHVRAQLDRLGAVKTRIVVTSDLDEFAIAALASAPVDSYGVGTSVVTGSGASTASLVYKMVARTGDDPTAPAWRAVAKASPGKVDHGGHKRAFRSHDANGRATAEVVRYRPDPADDRLTGTNPNERPLLTPLVRAGRIVGREPLEAARATHRDARGALPSAGLRLSPGEPAIDTRFEPDYGQ